jgi:hypothetical protein
MRLRFMPVTWRTRPSSIIASSAREQGHAVFERRNVAGHLAHVVQRHAGGALDLVEQEVGS